MVWLAALTVTSGLTVMVKVRGVPGQLVEPLTKLGVTVMVATMGAAVVLVAWKVAMSPVPVAARPIVGSEFVQL